MMTAIIETPSRAATLHLSQLVIPYRDAIGRLRIRDIYDWHQRIWDFFPGRDGDQRDFLFRVDRLEEAFRLLVLSQLQPVPPDWCDKGTLQVKPVPESFLAHSRYTFRLRANPTKKLYGRRVALKGEDLSAWMERKAAASGFVLEALGVNELGRACFQRSGREGILAVVEFEGVLAVTDREQFRSAVINGIGSAKAFGFGMLMLLPMHNLSPRTFSGRDCGATFNH
jgi:CRISPR system Cascade subunit CasE